MDVNDAFRGGTQISELLDLFQKFHDAAGLRNDQVGHFQIFAPDGNLLLFVGTRSTTPEPAKYMLPAGIDVDEDGRIYFIDQFFRKLDVFRPVTLTETDGWLGRKADATK